MTWQAPPDEAWYYLLRSPSDDYSLSSWLSTLRGLDRSFGRSALPRAPCEQRLREEYKTRDGKIALLPNTIEKDWICYQIWDPKEGTGNEKDLVLIHGINDYGGKFAVHARKFLDAGYRVIVPDMPSHGRSSGIHCYLPNMELLADAVYLVLADVLLHDSQSPVPPTPSASQTSPSTFTQTRKLFIAGQSMGGYAAVLTCLKYGSSSVSSLSPRPSVRYHPKISGGLFLCPMLEIAPSSRPSYALELVARTLASFAGVVPFASANKGKNSEDPSIEIEFNHDPQTYHGKLRIATGLSILSGITHLSTIFAFLQVPFKVFHGTGDRVTSPSGSKKLFEEAGSDDKELRLYEGYEHVLLRKGKDDKDDERRQRVLGDMLEWLQRH
ncbi:BQ2448_3836 [Microbotryum intermedium]|uniref:BQ2448_3836 protein n=1 Tax=Microbotryum intermedium TaxID=269621 RepID=A0A238FGQ8_9BASI|nr:BQ2448_3836 [Microbotryum intermedium]